MSGTADDPIDATVSDLSHEELMKYVDKFVPFKGSTFVVKRTSFNESYLWDCSPRKQENDDTDKAFLKNHKDPRFNKLVMHGYHDYGGYWGFFRPDIGEVSRLLAHRVSLSELEEIDRIYVNSEYISYLPMKDKQHAVTGYWIVKKTKPSPDSDSELTQEPPAKRGRPDPERSSSPSQEAS